MARLELSRPPCVAMPARRQLFFFFFLFFSFFFSSFLYRTTGILSNCRSTYLPHRDFTSHFLFFGHSALLSHSGFSARIKNRLKKHLKAKHHRTQKAILFCRVPNYDDDDDRFYIALFSALEQSHCAHVACDSK